MPTKVEGWKDEAYGNEVRERIYEFAEEGWESIPDDEHDAWFERFKWWGLYNQRKGQESYFMMRIGTPNGVLEPGQLEVVADVADEFARGPADNPEFGGAVCDWTTRQSIQLHWIKLEDIPEIWDRLESVGLSTQQACGDSWRNIVGCPVAGKDKNEFIDAWPVAEELNETFKGNDDYANLPRKWKVSVTGCSEGCGQGDINDLAFEPAVKIIDGEETKGFNIRVGGGLSRKEPRLARSIDVFVTPEEAPDIAASCSALFREHGDRDDRFNARIKFLVDEWGAEKFRRVLEEEFVDGELRTAGEDLRDEYTYNAGHNHDDGEGHADHVGVHEQPDGNYYVGLSVLVGRMSAEETRELAHLADEYGSGEVRLTQRQNIIVTDVDSDRIDGFLEEDLLEYHSPEPGVFMRGSIACTGTEYCSLSIVETKNRMVRYGRWMQDNIDVPEGMTNFHTHLSGCTASCAQPQIADISLRGMKTRKDGEPVEAFDIGLGGGLGENPQFADWVEMRVAADEVPGYIRNLVEFFAEAREDGESFRAFIARHDEEALNGLVEPEETSYTDPYMHNTKMTWYPYAEDDDMGSSPAPTNGQGEPLPSDD